MALPVVVNDVVVTNQVQKTKTPDRGLVTDTLYKGTKEKIEAKFNELAAIVDSLADLRVKWGDQGPAELTVTQGNNTSSSGGGDDSGEITRHWEIDGNTVQDPVENNAYWDNADTDQKDLVIKEYRDAKKSTAATDEFAKQLFNDCFMQGQEYVLEYNVVVRNTQTCATGSNIAPAFNKVFNVWTLNEIAVPSTLSNLGKLPSYLAGALLVLNFEYLKQPPRVKQLSKYRYNIITEWWGAASWPEAFYPSGSGTPLNLTL